VTIAGAGWRGLARWKIMERVMGIEYIAGVTLNVVDHGVAGDQELRV